MLNGATTCKQRSQVIVATPLCRRSGACHIGRPDTAGRLQRFRQVACAAIFLALCSSLSGQEPPARKVAISFLPPPLEGTISLGIYDSKGALVRVLHREADVDEFEIGADALKTTWDGKNNAGQAAPAGKYHARGYAMGDVEVDGVGYFFNDWISDEQSPRIRRVRKVWFSGGKLVVEAEVAGEESARFVCDDAGKIVDRNSAFLPAGDPVEARTPEVVEKVAADTGREGTLWVVDAVTRGAAEREVKQFSAANELLRRLRIPPGDPQPTSIAASKTDDRLFLLEENSTVQRLRALSLRETKQEGAQAVSDWKVEFEKKIVPHKDFRIENGQPSVTGGKAPAEKITVKLQPNALKNDARESVELIVAFDAEGSVLKTPDGLPLVSISETPRVSRVVLAPRNEKEIDVFQDDDAVVEQFRITNVDQMMAFDAGEFELK